MKNQLIVLNEENRKSFAFSDDKIIYSSKAHKTYDSLAAAVTKSGMLETVATIRMDDIKEIYFNEKEETFTIKYENRGKIKKESFNIAAQSQRDDLVAEIASMKQFSQKVEVESKTKPLFLNILGTLAVVAGTYIFRGMAIDAQNGIEYEATGRRRGLKKLFATAVEAIGPTGIIVIGALGLLYMIYRTYSRYNKPASDIKYS